MPASRPPCSEHLRGIARRFTWLGLACACTSSELPRPPPATEAPPSEPGSSSAAAQREPEALPPPPVASYTLRAQLDASHHNIAGEGTIVWRNTSSAPVHELYLHLYLNAFQSDQTLFYRSVLQRARGGKAPARWGHISLERLVARELGDIDLLPAMEPHSPGDPLDGTDRRVALPGPIEPGGTLTLDVGWTSVLPALRDRTGFSGNFHFVGQWFPKLARLEPDGTWAHFAFHPQGEFYADFGTYDVTLDVPSAMIVGATGHRLSEASEAGRRTLRYQAENVHDFAWTAWPDFREQHERIDGVDVHLLYPPGHTLNAKGTLDVLRLALPHFSARYGRYPYADLTVVHPPPSASNAGGMEYPTLITTGGAWHQSLWSRALENVTIHELGHQWFYGLVASDERRWPFLDEGLNSYAESIAFREFFGNASASNVLGFDLSSEALRRVLMSHRPHDLPISMAAGDFASFADLGGVIYGRTSLLFGTIANVYGEAPLAEALGRYTRRYRFAHPTPDQFLAVLAETLSPGAMTNLEGALLEGHGVDYEVRDLLSAPARAAPAPGVPGDDSARPEPLVESQVVVYRHGELEFPVEVALLAANGDRFVEHWDGTGRFHVLSHRGTSPIVSAVVDPEGKVLLDDNLLNNARSADRTQPLALWERSLFALELALACLTP
ncbi:MAG TPA: M1 family aminopeptidase [Polyangiaceae bacterium]|nr:M1 family aminopeptidase [Polyangiaceae bacterium]